MVYYLFLLVTGLGAGPHSPPPHHSSDSHQDHLVSLNSQAVITCQGYIAKLGLEGSSLPGAVLETLPPVFILFHFFLNYTEHLLELWLQPWLD